MVHGSTIKLRPPHGWVGGKRALAKDIIKLMPEHRLYVEVFGGALNVLYAKPKEMFKIKQNNKSVPYTEVINDINGDLINLHRVIQKYPDTLSYYLNNMLISREIFADIKLQKLKSKNNIERAAHYYYLLTQSFGGKTDNFAMSAKSRKPKNIYRDFSLYSKRLQLVTIENMSFEKLFKNYDKEDTFFYCDPPYYQTEFYYKNTGGFGEQEHILLRDLLSNIKGKFLLSYNDSPFIRELYKKFQILETKEIEYTLGKNSSGKQKKVREIFIKNY